MAIAFGAIARGKNDSTVSSLTYTGPAVTGSDKIGVVHVQTNSASGDVVTGITWAGNAMTRISVRASGNQYLYAYYILAPSSLPSIVITCSTNSFGIYSHAAYYTGVKQTGQPDSSATGSATGNLTLTTTTVADNSWKISLARNVIAGVPNAGTGTTIREGGGAYAIGSGDGNADVTPAGSTSMQWTTGSGTTWGIIYSVAPVAGGGFVPTPMMHHLQIAGGLM